MLGLGLGLSKPTFASVPLLLDTYSGAAAAYSLRKLNSDYSGSAIRVRESSGNTEADIGFVGGALDTTSLLAHCGANDGYVVTWFDQSGNSRDATNATAASQPQIVASGSVIIENSMPSIYFNRDILNIFSGFGAQTQLDIVAAFVDKETTAFKYFYDVILLDASLRVGSSEDVYNYASGGTNDNLPSTFAEPIDILSFAHHAASAQIWINGNLESSDTQASPNAGNFSIGAGNGDAALGFEGNYWELIVYTTDERANRTGIEANINAYYSIYS